MPKTGWLMALILAAGMRGDASLSDKHANNADPVLELDSDTLPLALKANDNLLVEFYAPWCGHCQALEPEYARAATQLRAEKYAVRLAKIDASAHRDAGKRYNVTHFPTIKFFSNGEHIATYTGLRKAANIATWLRQLVGPAVQTLTDSAEIEALKGNRLTVIGFFKDGDERAANALREAAGTLANEAVFALTTSEALFAEFGVTGDGGVVIFKQFDEGRSDFTSNLYTADALVAFVKRHSRPLVPEFSLDDAQATLGGNEATKRLLVFVGKNSALYQSALQSASKVAAKYRDKIYFTAVDMDGSDGAFLAAIFSVKQDETPCYRLILSEGNEMTRYRPEADEISEERMTEFLERYEAGKLQPYLLSQALPADWDAGPVKVLVGSNYNEVTRRSNKKVIVMLYSPHCDHCKRLAPLWQELGESYKDSTEIIVAKFDALANEAEGLKIRHYPTIKLYLPGAEAIEYSGARTLDGFIKFVESDGQVQTPKEHFSEAMLTGGETVRILYRLQDHQEPTKAASVAAQKSSGATDTPSADESSDRNEL